MSYGVRIVSLWDKAVGFWRTKQVAGKIAASWRTSRVAAAWRSDKILKVEWIYVAFLSLVAIMTFFFVDLVSLTIWSTNLLDVIWDGNLRGFYAFSAENIHGIYHTLAGMEIFALIPHAIWNIPIWIAQRFFHIEIAQSAYCLIWSKLYLVGLLAAACGVVFKISLLLDQDKNKAMQVCFLSVSSIFVFTGIYYAGQNDIFLLLLGLLSLYFLLKNKGGLFLLFAGLSILAKPFFLFPLVALLLLTEKNLLKVLGKLALCLSFSLPFKVLFLGAPLYRESLSAGSGHLIQRFLGEGTFPAGLGEFAPVMVCLGALYLFAFLKVPQDEAERNTYIIYVTAAAFLLIPLWTWVEFYRPLILIPLVPLLLVHNTRFFKLNIILEIVMSFSLSFAKVFYEEVYRTQYMKGLAHLFGVIEGQEFGGLPYYLYHKQGYDAYMDIYLPGLQAVFVLSVMALLVINFPAFREARVFQPGRILPLEKAGRGLLWLRLLIPLFFVGTALMCYGNVMP
jgi:hypothetical protein